MPFEQPPAGDGDGAAGGVGGVGDGAAGEVGAGGVGGSAPAGSATITVQREPKQSNVSACSRAGAARCCGLARALMMPSW